MRAATFLLCAISGYTIYLFISVFYLSSESHSNTPILFWWTSFVSEQETITCTNNNKCIVTGNIQGKTINSHDLSNNLKAFLFYGSNIELNNLPKHDSKTYWALFHEESPKNLPALRNKKLQQLFNITSTFSRHSSFPITLQYLKNLKLLTSKEYFLSVNLKNKIIKDTGQAAILYLQSDCSTPIGRDKYVQDLQKYIKIDSYGTCLNNKQLPQNLKLNGTYDLYSPELLKFSSKYKFIIAIENAKCNDYITEKLWRALIVGAIPIYLGSPTIKDWLPNHKSAILINDFATMQSVAEHIKIIDNNDTLYNNYLNHKLKQEHDDKVTNLRLINAYKLGNFGVGDDYDDVIPAFQCFVCDTVYQNNNNDDVKFSSRNNFNIYDCDWPEDNSFLYNSWQHENNQVEKW